MNRFVTLTSAQKETLTVIQTYTNKHEHSPTVTELAKILGLKSLRSVGQRIEALEKKGLITRDRFKHRSITILNDVKSQLSSDLIQVPVIASAGCDAMEVYAEQSFGEYIVVDKSLIGGRKDNANIAAVRAVGDSMQDAGIYSGDYVIVEVTGEVENGDRVVAILGNMAVIKRYSRVDEVVYLNPENRYGTYHPIVVREEDSRIFGKVLSIIPGTEWVDDIKIEYYTELEPMSRHR
ncbi:MAG: SOS-response transcriptional repressor, LexA [Parcubacteria group bacterium]|nr:SOS-response transcriptional repressor, LexA [Parcubacteria group bacterium]